MSKWVKLDKDMVTPVSGKWIKYTKDMLVPLKSWCRDVAANTLEQALNMTRHPAVFHHSSLMADAGYGYGMPIGGVMACKDAVIPNAVGKDIGCGMRSVKTSLKIQDINSSELSKIRDYIKAYVPVGFNHHKVPQSSGLEYPETLGIVSKQQLDSLPYQIGTLGGGNHFIEIQVDEEDNIWLMIHSGSRNFGSKVCDFYNSVAKDLNKKWHSKVDEKWDLAFLPIGSKAARDYLNEMKFAMHFAFENRRLISERIKLAFNMVINCDFEEDLDVHHNYATIEHHFGKDVWIHRKGATSARKNQLGIIPGSMGVNSYIVKGLGNPDSYMSCSHGAGRPRSCTESSNILSKEECNRAMEGILFDGWGVNRKGNTDLGEAPGAYKDIEVVMESQKDLAVPIVKLRPIAVVKNINKVVPKKKKK